MTNSRTQRAKIRDRASTRREAISQGDKESLKGNPFFLQNFSIDALMDEASDKSDFHRDWGFQLLPRNDPAFRDPEYLKGLHALAVPTITNFGGTAGPLLQTYLSAFEDLASGRIVDFAPSGTSANNLLLSYADEALHRRQMEKNKELKVRSKSTLIFLDDPYVGLQGELAYQKYNPESLIRGVPVIHPNRTLGVKETQDLALREEKTLEKIAKMIDDPNSTVGGIFLEPISVNHGPVRIYRSEFLKNLQKIAHERGVPVFADEIMSGGGRTGKFWGYQHYRDFVPDVLIFGKGLVLSGLFIPKESELGGKLQKGSMSSYTTASNSLALLQALQVLKALKSRKLIENAQMAGQTLRERLIKEANLNEDSVRCVGLMCSVEGTPRVLHTYGSRWLPPITLDNADIDDLIKEMKSSP